MKEALNRILASRKSALAGITVVGNVVAQLSGQFLGVEVDPTEGISLVFNGAMTVLLGVQALLDLRWGSPSDGTGE